MQVVEEHPGLAILDMSLRWGVEVETLRVPLVWWWGMRWISTQGRWWGKWRICRRSRLRDFLLLDIVHQPLVLLSIPAHLQLLVNPGPGILDLRQTDISLMWQVGVDAVEVYLV